MKTGKRNKKNAKNSHEMFMEERPKGLLPSTSDKTMNERRIKRKAGSMSTHSCDVE
jgi:hypothetical protein